ncbi:hypothetical protein PM082_010102 [Marasmius tenuissimus]|nr:hypothetical protein PM082_010102 [Marasmius tenuissimus]
MSPQTEQVQKDEKDAIDVWTMPHTRQTILGKTVTKQNKYVATGYQPPSTPGGRAQRTKLYSSHHGMKALRSDAESYTISDSLYATRLRWIELTLRKAKRSEHTPVTPVNRSVPLRV